MKILTVVSSVNHPGFQLLRLSCALNNLELIALVANKYDLSCKREKDALLKVYLESETDDDEIILFSDGYDAIFLASDTEILEKFKNTGADLVFSTETACWPDSSLAGEYPENIPGPYKFLNSGGFIGRSGTIKGFLNDDSGYSDKYPQSNQYVWTTRFLKNSELIRLDTSCQLFCTFSPEVGKHCLPMEGSRNHFPYYEYMKDWFETNFCIDNGRIYNRCTQSWPCQAHFNGHAKHLMDNDIVDMLFEMIPNSRPVRFLYEMEV
jgi:hypothetical protein